MRLAGAGAMLLLAGCATPSTAVVGEPIALRNPGFEDPPAADAKCAPSWGCGGHAGVAYHDKRLVQGSHAWRRLQAEFDVPGDAQVLRVGATLEGPGTLWIDDARLERLARP